MASEDDPTPFNDDDLEDSSSSLPNDIVSNSISSSSSSSSDDETDDVITTTTTAPLSPLTNNTVTIAAIPSLTPTPTTPTTAPTALTTTLALPKPKPLPLDPTDPSRRLFQRLWTDEDEIELLNGFLEYSTSKSTIPTSSSSSHHHHHHDTSAFYDQIKSKLQLDFNKSQLVEKLRRLKKKYRNVLSKMSTGKDFQFKTPHDQATFEISQKIWSNLSPPTPANVAIAAHKLESDFDEESILHHHHHHHNGLQMMVAPPQQQSQQQQHAFPGFSINLNEVGGGYQPTGKLTVSRKRSRPGGKMEEKFVRVNLGGGEAGVFNSNDVNANNNNNVASVGVGGAMQGLIEEAVRNCLSPVLNELVNNLKSGAGSGGGGGGGVSGVVKGIEDLAKIAVPLNFSGVSMGDGSGMMEEKWRKQQILELEVYSRRLELVQEQIQSTLEELRSRGG